MPKPKSLNETLANFRVDRDKWQAFISRCAREGLSASEKIKTFIDGYLAGLIDTTPTAQDPRVDELATRLEEVEERLGKLRQDLSPTSQRQQKLISRFFAPSPPTTTGESPKTS